MRNKVYLSKKRYEELKKELHILKTVKRREVAERLKQAKEYGDLSENSEYNEARDEQEQVEKRIFELEELLKNASIIKKSKGSIRVIVGSSVTVKKDNRIHKYQIVGSSEARPEEGKISNESPLGKAFLGKKVGDLVEVATPRGKEVYQIISIG